MNSLKLILSIIVVKISVLVNSGQCETWTDAKTEYENLYKANAVSDKDSYTDVIPSSNYSQPLEVSLSMQLYALGGYDAVNGALDVMGSLEMKWTDEIVTGVIAATSVPEVIVDYRALWTPVIVLMNSADSVERVGDETYKVRINSLTGEVKWKPRMIIKASCAPDVRYFPFDQQKCYFTFRPWFQDASKIKLSVSSETWNLEEYGGNGVWTIESTKATAYQSGDFYVAVFEITINRAPNYFTFNLVLPILFLSLLSGVVFLLPAASGERVGFGITCFLSFVVLLQTTMNFLPQASSPMSLLCFYLIIMMIFSAFLSIVNILMLRIYNKPKGDKIYPWLIRFIYIIQCVICRRKLCKRKSNAVRDESVSSISSSSTQQDTEEKGMLLKEGKGMPRNTAFRTNPVGKDSTTRVIENKHGVISVIEISANSVISESLPERNDGAPSENDNSTTSSIEEEEDQHDVDWDDLGRILDIFFLVLFLGAQGAFSFFFLVPLGTKY